MTDALLIWAIASCVRSLSRGRPVRAVAGLAIAFPWWAL